MPKLLLKRPLWAARVEVFLVDIEIANPCWDSDTVLVFPLTLAEKSRRKTSYDLLQDGVFDAWKSVLNLLGRCYLLLLLLLFFSHVVSFQTYYYKSFDIGTCIYSQLLRY